MDAEDQRILRSCNPADGCDSISKRVENADYQFEKFFQQENSDLLNDIISVCGIDTVIDVLKHDQGIMTQIYDRFLFAG